jgi:hypothetical protein
MAARREHSLIAIATAGVVAAAFGLESATAQQSPPPFAFGSSCSALAGLGTTRTTVTYTLRIHAGEDLPSLSIASPAEQRPPIGGLPEFCRLILTSKSAAGSPLDVEAWLPVVTWNGRLELGGALRDSGPGRYLGLAAAIARGYAAAAMAPPAPVATTIDTDVMHEVLDAVKRVVTSYYGRGPKRAYFAGCGDDARLGLELAARHPNDVDGVLAGAPAAGAGLTTFLASDGVLLLHHGAGDEARASTVRYFESLTRNARLFLIPGAEACPRANAPAVEALTAALAGWVELGRAPDQVRPAGAAAPLLCAYPRTADAANAVCR